MTTIRQIIEVQAFTDIPPDRQVERFVCESLARLAAAHLLPRNYAGPDSALGATTYGAALAALVKDVDRDGKPDIDVVELARSPVVAHGATVAKLTRALTTKVAEDQLEGGGKASAVKRDALAPQLTIAAQRTVAVRERSDIMAKAASVELRTPYVLDRDGVLARFAGEIPAGARVFDSVSLVVGQKSAALVLRSPGAPDYRLAIDGRGHAVSTRCTQESAHAVLGELLAAAEGAALAPTAVVTQYAAHLRAQEAIVSQLSEPADPAEAVVWRAANASDDVTPAQRAAQDQTGVRPLQWLRYVSDVRYLDVIRDTQAAAGHGISPAFLFTVCLGEGLGLYLDAHTRADRVAPHGVVDGFQYLGADTFASRAEDLRDKGLLPADFTLGRDYTVATNVNELHERVHSGNFPSVRAGMIAVAALLADERTNFLRDAATIVGADATAQLTDTQIDFFTYVYFNAGPTCGRQILAHTHDFRAADPWLRAQPTDNHLARFNALQRLSTLHVFTHLAIF